MSALAFSASSLPTRRDGQLAGVTALAAGRDGLAVMPTGYGKSAIHQVAVCLHTSTGRPAVVVSPVIALLEDQLAGLAGALGEDAAVAINSGLDGRPADRRPTIQAGPPATASGSLDHSKRWMRTTSKSAGRGVNQKAPTAAPLGDAAGVPFPVQSAVTHKEWGAGLVMRCEDGVITVLFEREDYKCCPGSPSRSENC